MVTPMLKYTFLVYHRDYLAFLEALQDVGVVEIVERDVEMDEETLGHLRDIRQLRQWTGFLKRRKITPGTQDTSIEAADLVTAMEELEAERERIRSQINTLQKEISRIQPWGDFSAEKIDKLQEAGVTVRFFICPAKKFDPAWEEAYHTGIINVVQSSLYFVIFQQRDETIEIEAEEIAMPQRPLRELKALVEEDKKRLDEIERTFDTYAERHTESLEKALSEAQEKTEFRKAVLHTRKEAADKLMVLQGWVPVTKEEKLTSFLDTEGILYLTSPPLPEEKVPVLLNNGRFTRLFEPIGRLFSLPDYMELDLTPFFAPFFMMFFGFCLGDAGYGLILLAGGTLLKRRVDRKLRPVLTLVQFFGLATVFFGILTGTFFGIALARVPSLETVRSFFLNNNQVFWLAIIIGLVQILFGTGLRAANQIKRYGFVYGLSSIGWILLVIGVLDAFKFKVAGVAGYIVLFAGIFLIVFFSNPKAGILGRIGRGLWDLYGITGIFGDVLSYVRLFALGVSSSILGLVINDIAMQIKGASPVIGPILFVIFLLLGHTLNIAISCLGAFVHPMRLTFVEFYKNAGFSGGGKPYKPFSRTQ
jgi:V/A-type H+-transporting ATPase subunit I